MNAFLLMALPLAAPLLYRLLFRRIPVISLLRNALFSLVWSLILLVMAMVLYPLGVFRGDLVIVSLGLVLVQGLLVPGVPLAVHLWPGTRPRNSAGDADLTAVSLGMTLTLFYAFVGVGDFLTTSRQSDLWDLFLAPLVRIGSVLGVIALARTWLISAGKPWSWLSLVALGLFCLVPPGLNLLWLSGSKGAAAALTVALAGVTVWLLVPKKAVPTAADGVLLS